MPNDRQRCPACGYMATWYVTSGVRRWRRHDDRDGRECRLSRQPVK